MQYKPYHFTQEPEIQFKNFGFFNLKQRASGGFKFFDFFHNQILRNFKEIAQARYAHKLFCASVNEFLCCTYIQLCKRFSAFFAF